MFCAEVNVGMLHLNLIKIRCLLYLFFNIPYGGHVGVHIFNQPISNESTKSLDIKRGTHQELLWSICLTVLQMIGRSKMNERLHDMAPNGML